jgi:hypothetical protein
MATGAVDADAHSNLYYTADMAEDFVALRGDALPRDEFVQREASASEGTTEVWLGGPGVTAQTHYDPTHNFFLQVWWRGRARRACAGPRHAS